MNETSITDPIAHQVAKLPVYQNASTVCVYMALADEVSTVGIVDMVLRDRKTLLAPKVISTTQMVASVVSDLRQLSKGAFGILEPGTGAPYGGPINVIIIPGRAFTERGDRRGRGRGYYDRFLATHTESIRIGLAHESQLTSTLGVQPHDVRMHYVVTEKRTLGPFF